MAPTIAPWDVVPAPEQHFVLITGANSGVGLGIGQRLIDQFLLTYPVSSHLVLVTTTRSARKSRETIHALRTHLEGFVNSSHQLQKRFSTLYDTQQSAISRIHILSIQLDLCDLGNIYRVADTLVHATISNPPNLPATKCEYPLYENVKLTRLDAAIFNAGIGGWTGLDWLGLIKMVFTRGIVQTMTWPTYKLAEAGKTIYPLQKTITAVSASTGKLYVLGEVFTANVFGHYVFAHELLPLLSRRAGSELGIPRGRVIWTSSIEAMAKHLDIDDLQGLRSLEPYESSKRLTDILVLTSSLPGVASRSKSYFTISADAMPPKMYLTHPGVVVTTIFPVPWVFVILYRLAMYIARWLGSPWHPVTAYLGACASVWLALEADIVLEDTEADKVKWGSSCTRMGVAAPKRSEVEGWGWEGIVVTKEKIEEEKGLMGRAIGRAGGAKHATEEDLQKFEELGASCWEEMEKLRAEWEKRVKEC